MTRETKLEMVLDDYYNRTFMVESKADIDREGVMDNDDCLTTKEVYAQLFEIQAGLVQKRGEIDRETIRKIIEIMKED